MIGSGISGLACAHVLGPHHDVVVFEADHRLGGHANTVDVDDPVAGRLAVDTGFIVHNDRNYPNLVRLFSELGVATVDTEMSFGDFLRWLLIAAIIIAIVFFLGGQALQIGKSWE